MRAKSNPQVGINFATSNLKLTNAYYAQYEAVSSMLDANPQIVSRIHVDLKKPIKYARAKTGQDKSFQYTSEQVLRILVAQILEGESLRGIVVRIDDSNYLRHFTRIDSGPMMDYTTLCKLKNSIRMQTWTEVNQLLACHAVTHGLISGDKLRLDTTAVETNIHWPTDSSLLWDLYRTLASLIEHAREIDTAAVGNQRLHRKRTKRLYTKISRTANKKGKRRDALKPLYKNLIGRVEGICDWTRCIATALRVGRKNNEYSFFDDLKAAVLIQEIRIFLQRGDRVLDQARRRVLLGESVPNDEKIFSIFEPHTELLKRGKAGKDIEFGHMIQIQQVQEKFITGYEVFEKKPIEHRLLSPAVENHKDLFKHYPKEISADKGYYESMQALEELQRKVPVVAIGKKGKRDPQQEERECNPLFKLAQRFRAGVEGSISYLKRILRLHRCLNKGWEHFAATVGQTVFAHNLLILARL